MAEPASLYASVRPEQPPTTPIGHDFAPHPALGHAKRSVTLDLYGHLMPSNKDRIRAALDLAWNPAEG